MTDSTEIKPAKVDDLPEGVSQAPAPPRIPQYRRDIWPKNIVLSAADLADLCRLLLEANDRAKNIEFNSLDLSKFDSPEQARAKVNDLVQLEYNYVAGNGDSVRGLGLPKVEDRTFPEDIDSFFVSNAAYTKRAIDVEPLNVVAIFLSFSKPSLKIDLRTLPSNPTENKSVINVYGRDEDWVISTTNRLQEFLRQKQAFRPVLHGSGTYDYFVHLAFLPAVIWVLVKRGGQISYWLDGQSVFLNVILAIYVFFISLLFARFVFQYFRWLFPPTEYYKSSRVGAYTHRIVFGAVLSAVVFGAAYDLVKGLFASIF